MARECHCSGENIVHKIANTCCQSIFCSFAKIILGDLNYTTFCWLTGDFLHSRIQYTNLWSLILRSEKPDFVIFKGSDTRMKSKIVDVIPVALVGVLISLVKSNIYTVLLRYIQFISLTVCTVIVCVGYLIRAGYT